MQNMFSRIAPRYDYLNRVMSLGVDLIWRRMAIKQACFTSGGTILDLGAGSGDVSMELVRFNADFHVVAVDNCFELIEIGRDKMRTRKLHNDWVSGDGRFLPFADESFDGLFAAFSLRNMASLDTVFNEIKRILRPGGKIVILDMAQPRPFVYRQIFNFHFKYIVPRLGKWLGNDPDAYTYLLPSIKNFYKSDELRDELIKFGYKDVQLRKLMFHTISLCIGTK